MPQPANLIPGLNVTQVPVVETVRYVLVNEVKSEKLVP